MVDEIERKSENLLPVSEVARRLGVGQQQVRQWIRDKQIDAIKIGRAYLVPSDAVEKFRRSERPPGRPLSPANAWGILFMAAGQPVRWLSPNDRWRLRGYLARHPLSRIPGRLRVRANALRLRAHPSVLNRLRNDPNLMLSGISAAARLRLGLLGGENEVDGYVRAAQIDDLVRRYALRASSDPNVVLRVVPEVGIEALPPVAPLPAVALDLLEHAEPRVQQVGRDLLARAGS